MNCRIAFAVAAVLVLSVVSETTVFAAPNMKEGQWEISAEMKMEGMPFAMPAMPIKYSTCLTKKDMVPQKKEKNMECSEAKPKVQGDTVNWSVKCKDKNGNVTESTGRITYKGNAFDGSMKNVTTDTKGAKSVSNMKMAGKRVGDCK